MVVAAVVVAGQAAFARTQGGSASVPPSEKAATPESSAGEAGRERINTRLIENAASIQEREAELVTLEGNLKRLETEEQEKRGSLKERHAKIVTLLAALQRMGRNPPPVMATPRKDALEMVRSAMLLSAAFPELRDKALALGQDIEDLARVIAEAGAKRDQVKADLARLGDEKTRLSGLLAEKKEALKSWQPEIAEVGREMNAVSTQAADPNQLIDQATKVVTAKTGLGAYDAALRSGLGAPAPPAGKEAPPQTKGVEVAAVAPRPPSVVELAPIGGPRGDRAGRMKPARPFHLARAQLPLPAQGRRVIAFGDKTKGGKSSNGMVIETRVNAQITSPCDGWILYAGQFRSYGQLLIINAGDGYHVILAGLSQIDVQPGQFVLAAEPVGTMGGGPAGSRNQSETAVLYVEFRKDKHPIDPNPWWVAKVQQ